MQNMFLMEVEMMLSAQLSIVDCLVPRSHIGIVVRMELISTNMQGFSIVSSEQYKLISSVPQFKMKSSQEASNSLISAFHYLVN